MQCGAQHQAVRHHTKSTDGAARHAGCSGPMRPGVTARRRRQGSVGQVRECTGPAMPQHTYTQRAHNTHSPARLPVPVGRHPGLCLLVIAPSAHHTTSHHTTQQHQHSPVSTNPWQGHWRPNAGKYTRWWHHASLRRSHLLRDWTLHLVSTLIRIVLSISHTPSSIGSFGLHLQLH